MVNGRTDGIVAGSVLEKDCFVCFSLVSSNIKITEEIKK